MESFSGHRIQEAAIVEIAIGLLNTHLNHGKYLMKCEYPYKLLGVNGKQRADIVVFEKKDNDELTPICVMEFKLSDDANGGVKGDVKKMSYLSSDLHRLTILLSYHLDRVTSEFITANGNAKKGKIILNNTPVHVVRAAKAMEGTNSNYAKRAICIELLSV